MTQARRGEEGAGGAAEPQAGAGHLGRGGGDAQEVQGVGSAAHFRVPQGAHR